MLSTIRHVNIVICRSCILTPISQITVPDALIEEAKHHWAPPTDPIFDLVPPDSEQHISSSYAQIGSPTVGFHSFWEVYNALRDVVDSEILSRHTVDTPEEEDGREGADGNPAARTIQDEGEQIIRLFALFLLDLLQSPPDMPELYVEFTDEDDDGALAAQPVQDESMFVCFYHCFCHCFFLIQRIHHTYHTCQEFTSSSLTRKKKRVYSLLISFLCCTDGLFRGDPDG